ncbi:MAG TPA: hypothetical protein VH538_12190 [Gaiellaceae bacterium]
MKTARSFAALSAALTGFRTVDLWGTGQVDVYLDELIATVGEDVVARLLAAGDEALVSSDPKKALGALLADDELGPVGRNVIVLWYSGAWRPLPGTWRNRYGASTLDVARVISPASYRSGLVWQAIGAHPKGANGPGFASWANPPTVPGAG